MLQAVLFDLMDVVIADPYREAVRAATGLDLAELRSWKDPECWPDFELGRIDEAEFARRFFGAASPSAADAPRFDLEAFNRARRQGYAFVPGMARLLDALAGVVERHVASNYPVWIEEIRAAFELDRRFEGIWASCYLGARKPDPVFFQRLLEDAGLEPQLCLFVDDRAANCRGAEEVGLRTHHFRGAADLARRLLDEGVDGGQGLQRLTRAGTAVARDSSG